MRPLRKRRRAEKPGCARSAHVWGPEPVYPAAGPFCVACGVCKPSDAYVIDKLGEGALERLFGVGVSR